MEETTASIALGLLAAAVCVGVAVVCTQGLQIREAAAVADDALIDCEHKMTAMGIAEALAKAEARQRQQMAAELDEASETVYRGGGLVDTDPSAVSAVMPLPCRFSSGEIKSAVNQVLMPKMLAHQNRIAKAKKKYRAGEIDRAALNQMVRSSANAFDLRYAEAIDKATAIVLTLSADEPIPLRRLASSNESWESAAMLLRSTMSRDLDDADGQRSAQPRTVKVAKLSRCTIS